VKREEREQEKKIDSLHSLALRSDKKKTFLLQERELSFALSFPISLSFSCSGSIEALDRSAC